MKTSTPGPYKNNSCDNCTKDMGQDWRRYCADCRKAIQERAAPQDCTFCEGKQTVRATYQMEGDWGAPYICHACMKDQDDGYVWPHIPANAMNLDAGLAPDELSVMYTAQLFDSHIKE